MTPGEALVLLAAGWAAVLGYWAFDALVGWVSDGAEAGERP